MVGGAFEIRRGGKEVSFRNKDWDEVYDRMSDKTLICEDCGEPLGVHKQAFPLPICPVKLPETPVFTIPQFSFCDAFSTDAPASSYMPAKAPEAHPLTEAFEAAVNQTTHGKGERHGGEATPFWEQEWYAIAQDTGVGGLMFQGIKKAKEACRKPNQAAFETELLGSLVYLGMAYLYVRKHGFKPRDEG
jgi:hypothetical protein